MLWFPALSSRRFQRGFDGVNLHRATDVAAARPLGLVRADVFGQRGDLYRVPPSRRRRRRAGGSWMS